MVETSGGLERKLRRQLNSPRPAAPKERIANAHVACGHNLIRAISDLAIAINVESATATRSKVRCGIGDKGRQFRVGEVRMIEHVEEFGAQLHIHTFRDCRVFVDC